MTGSAAHGFDQSKGPTPLGSPGGVLVPIALFETVMTNRIRTLLLCVLAAACGGDATAPTLSSTNDATLAAETFDRMADSVARAGGDSDVGDSYAALADVVRMGGRLSPIVITIDGVATEFVATAFVTELSNPSCTGDACPPEAGFVARTLIAWERGNPRRVIQLASTMDTERIGVIRDPSPLALYARPAYLTYLDGQGGSYFGTSGAQAASVVRSETPCAAPAASGTRRPSLAQCTHAEVTFSFAARAESNVFRVAVYQSSAEHTISMAAQPVHGSHLLVTPPAACDTGCGGPTPPVVVQPSERLPATLTATGADEVTLTLAIRNPSPQPITLSFATGQKFDFVVIDSLTGRKVWQWSADRGFTQALEERTVPGHGTLSYSATWRPTSRGLYLARGYLKSSSHRAEAYASVDRR